MRPLIAASLCVVLFASAPAGAQNVAYEKYTLPNGMTVILHEDHALPVACINVWYYVASKDEAAGRSGFAHLFEHLMFMGTRRVPGNAFDVLMESGGGYNNASTSEDRTNYFSFGPSSLLPTLLWLDADRLDELAKTMTQEKLDLQRSVVRNERRQTSEMQPYGRAELKVCEMMYPEDHPYHHPVIGSHEDLEAATLQDVIDFFNTNYVPNNASLVVAGDFDSAEIKPLVAGLFGTLPRQSDPVHRQARPVLLPGVTRVTFTDNVQFARTYYVYHSPALFKPGDAEMDLAAAILADGTSSRLYQRLIYKDKLATSVRAYQSSMMLGSLFYVEITAKPGVTLDRIEAAADEVLAEFAAKGPTPDELARRQTKTETGMISGLQSLLARADRLNQYNYYLGEPDSFAADLDRYRKATPQSVREWAAKTLTPDARLVMRVLPDQKAGPSDTRETRPGPLASKDFAPPSPQTFTLSNGVPVRHWRRSELPLVNVLLLFGRGACEDDPAQSGLTMLTAGMLDEGAGELGAVEFADALDMLGANLGTRAEQESVTLTLSVLKRNFDRALSLLGDAVMRPRFDPKEWDRVRTLHLEALKQAEDRPTAVAGRVGLRAFFGDDHPYGRPVDGTTATAGRLTLDDLKKRWQGLFQPGQVTVFIAGDLDADEAKASLEKVFGGWKPGPAETAPRTTASSMPAPANKALRVVVVDKPGAVQTVIRFYMPGVTFRSPDRVPLEMLGTVLGGSFTSRLNQNLREKHGYTYGARSSYAMEPSAGYFTASADVRADVTGAALGEFLKEFTALRGGDVSADEAAKAAQTRRTNVVQAFQGLSGLLGTAANYESCGLPISTLGDDLAALAATDADRLNELARPGVPLEQAVVVLVGDKATILAQLADVELPKPVELSVTGEAMPPPDADTR